jgi:hypothetical protein
MQRNCQDEQDGRGFTKLITGGRTACVRPRHFQKEGALADLILVDGNPLENFDLVANPEKSLNVIMKDGKI